MRRLCIRRVTIPITAVLIKDPGSYWVTVSTSPEMTAMVSPRYEVIMMIAPTSIVQMKGLCYYQVIFPAGTVLMWGHGYCKLTISTSPEMKVMELVSPKHEASLMVAPTCWQVMPMNCRVTFPTRAVKN